MLVALGVLPFATYALMAYVLLPNGPDVFAPLRLALVRAAVLVAGCAVVLVEVLSVVRALTFAALLTGWSLALLAAFGAALTKYTKNRPHPVERLRKRWAATSRVDRLMVSVLSLLVLGELVIALASPPNNYDSQTYHLPKIEHWVVQRDVAFYPTAIHRQLSMAPGAEYLLLHLRLLTGGDAAYNLLQLAAGVGCALLASRIAGQLGGGPRAQLLAAFVVTTTPIVALESTSTQTDLVVAAWVAGVATLVLDQIGRRTGPGELLLLGGATGLTVLTKATGLLAIGLLLLVWLVDQLRRHLWRAQVGALVIGAVAVAVAGPYLLRVDEQFASPLGPDNLRKSISMERHDPAAIAVNTLRIAETALQTPIGPLNRFNAAAIERFSHALGVDPNDPRITFAGPTFPYLSWPPDEDRASFPIHGALVLLGAGFLLVRPQRRVPLERAALARSYALVFWLALACYVSVVKWQPWGNRLVLFVLVLGAPLAGLWLDPVLRRLGDAVAATSRTAWHRPLRRVGAWVAVAALVAGGSAAGLAVGYGWPRRLIGPGSVFTESEMEARFQRRPQWRADYEWAAAAVRASGAHRIGLVQGYDTWEYPWWILLRGADLVSLQSLEVNPVPPRPETMDAIVCVNTERICSAYIPAGWQLRWRDGVGYALRP